MSTADERRPSLTERFFAGFKTIRHYLRLTFRPFLPRGLYGRAALILLVPIITIQLVFSYSFIQRLYEGVTVQMTQNIAVEIELLLQDYRNGDNLIRQADILNIDISHPEKAAQDSRLFYDLSGKVVTDTLYRRFSELKGVDLMSVPGRVHLSFDTDKGLLDFDFSRRRVSAANPHQLIVLMTATTALMSLIAYFFLRNQLRPIRRLARAAEAFGKGEHVEYQPRGASEVRSAGWSFLDMRERLERQMEQRTIMLSGVSHDLRTPLTRLKLALSMSEENDETEDMIADVNQMERLIASFLDFTRSNATENPEPADLVAILHDVVGKAARSGAAISVTDAPDDLPVLPLRRLAIERALDNLVSNGLRYGHRVDVSLQVAGSQVTISVEDDGPGIPPELVSRALQPFARLDPARNQNKGGGVGLGLTIAADIAMSHGGTIHLDKSDRLGGLRARIVLPFDVPAKTA